jgi:recombination protein RecA
MSTYLTRNTNDIRTRLQKRAREANHHDEKQEGAADFGSVSSTTGRIPEPGKCIPADTYIWTDRGLQTIEEIFDRADQNASCTNRTTNVSSTPISAVNEDGRREDTVGLTHNYKRKIWEVTLSSGRTLEATARHPIRVINNQGWIVWRNIEDLKPGDIVVSALFGAEVSRTRTSNLTCDEAEFMGYLVSDGTLSWKNCVGHSNKDDDVRTRIAELTKKLFGLDVKVYGQVESRLGSKRVRQKLAEDYGLKYTTAEGKCIPEIVRNAHPEVQRSFLGAYFDGDGHFAPDGSAEIVSASRDVAEVKQHMLYGFGIPCTMSPKTVDGYDQTYWRLYLGTKAVNRFIRKIGVYSKRRQKQVMNRSAGSRCTYATRVPNTGGLVDSLRNSVKGDRKINKIISNYVGRNSSDCSPHILRQIVDWADDKHLPAPAQSILSYFKILQEGRFTFEEVKSINEVGKRPTFNITQSRTQSLLTNGMISLDSTGTV